MSGNNVVIELDNFLRKYVAPVAATLELSVRGRRFEPRKRARQSLRYYSSVRFNSYPLPGPKISFQGSYGVISVAYAAWEARANDPENFVVKATNYLWHDTIFVPGRGWRAIRDAGATRMEGDWAFNPDDPGDVEAVGTTLAGVIRGQVLPTLSSLQDLGKLLDALLNPTRGNQLVPAGEKLAPLILLADMYSRDALEAGIQKAQLKDIPYFQEFRSWAFHWNEARNASS